MRRKVKCTFSFFKLLKSAFAFAIHQKFITNSLFFDVMVRSERTNPNPVFQKTSTLRQLAAATLCSAQFMLKKATFKPLFFGYEQKSFQFFGKISLQINAFYPQTERTLLLK